MQLLIKNIGCLAGIIEDDSRRLCGKAMAHVNTLTNAWLIADEGVINDFGIGEEPMPKDECRVIDACGAMVMPCFADPHTHIVYAHDRGMEFRDKICGLSYEQIAQRGGGILNSVDALHDMTEDELFETSLQRVNEAIATGTGCMEIKSGYGLSTEDELKMLRVIRRIRQTSDIEIRSTFLGAHAVARRFGNNREAYVDYLITEMLPAVGEAGLADFIDVFCDRGFFTADDTARILEAGARWGMRPKIHADELAAIGGVKVGADHNALSIDHLENMPDDEMLLLHDTPVMPTVLPGTSFFLNMPYAPARRLIDSGLPVAIASDMNPGSTPSSDMRFCMSLACIKMRLLPEEAFNAATINAAYAMGVSHSHGSITRGKAANLIITKPHTPDITTLTYRYTRPAIERIILKGEDIA